MKERAEIYEMEAGTTSSLMKEGDGGDNVWTAEARVRTLRPQWECSEWFRLQKARTAYKKRGNENSVKCKQD